MDDRFQSILKLKESEEAHAVKQYVEAKVVYEESETRLNDLKSFMSEYRQNHRHSGTTPPVLGDQSGHQSGDSLECSGHPVKHNSQQFQSTREFLSRLSDAIDQQEQHLTKNRDAMSIEREEWTSRRVNRRSIEMLMGKRAVALIKAREKTDQTNLDEIVSQRLSGHQIK